MKKRFVIIAVLIVSLVMVFFIQKNRIENKLLMTLAQHHIQARAENIHLQLSPLALILNDIHYSPEPTWQVKIPYGEIQFGWWSLFTSNPAIKFIHLGEAKVSLKSLKVRSNLPTFDHVNLSLKPTALSLTDLAQGQFINKPFHLDLYFTRKDKTFSKLIIRHGVLQRMTQNNYQFHIPNMLINKAVFNQVNAQILSNGTLYFRSKQGDFDIYAKPPIYRMVGKNIEISTVFAAIDIDSLMQGRSEVSGSMQFEDETRPTGNMRFQVNNGKISGINLLAMISQYLPINYDEQELAQQMNDTDFESATAELAWNEMRLIVEQINIATPKLNLQGKGKMEFASNQCDFQTEFAPTEKKYRKVVVPIHFFGDCHSPQYKLKFNRDLQRSLRNFLKERFRNE